MADTDSIIKAATRNYGHKQMVINECKHILADFKDLRPMHKSHSFLNGQSKKLLCLEGTIPIQYKSRTYNIPLAIWIVEAHPYTAPMVYVQPTATMNIKPGPNVSSQGLVSVPFLKEWRHPSSDLAGLIQILQIMFGESPPVFAKSSRSTQPPGRPANPPHTQPSAAQASPYPPASSDSDGKFLPILNHKNAPGVGMPQPQYPAASGSAQTPYPTATGSGSQYPAYPSVSNTQTTSTNSSGMYNQYGPRPPYPLQSTNFPQPYGQGSGFSYPGNTSSPGYPPAQNPNSSGYPATTSSGYPSYPSGPGGYPGSGTGYSGSNTPYPPTTSSYGAPYSSNTAQKDTSQVQTQSSLSEQEIRESLRSAVADKMRRKIRELVATQTAEMDALRQTQTDLKAGRDKLDSMMSQMNQEQNECEASVAILNSRIEELKGEVARGSGDREVKPEDAIDTVAPLYKQLMNSFAEEQALDDALYLLGKAHAKEIISAEIYLKKVRDLSRRHFMQRATIQKCREKAGLSDIYS